MPLQLPVFVSHPLPLPQVNQVQKERRGLNLVQVPTHVVVPQDGPEWST